MSSVLLREFSLAVPLACALVHFGMRAVAGEGGIAHIADDQIAVVTDHIRERSWVVTEPGIHAYLPWLQELATFDKSPNEDRLEGAAPTGVNHAPQLKVRANDGSSMWFESIALHYVTVLDVGQLTALLLGNTRP